MAIPTTRQEFKAWCLRKLGAPVNEIELADEQIEDRIDEALKYYMDYHFDGSEKTYYKHEVTQDDKDNGYISVPESIIGVTRIFSIGDPSTGAGDMFNIQYQIALNDLYSLTSTSMVPYYMARTNLSLIQEILVGKDLIDFNRHTDRIYVRMNWDKVPVGNYLLFECYSLVDPELWPDVWGDRWLQNYATCLIQENWGFILTKYSGTRLTGDMIFNAEKMYNDALATRKKLEDEMIYTFSIPALDMLG